MASGLTLGRNSPSDLTGVCVRAGVARRRRRRRPPVFFTVNDYFYHSEAPQFFIARRSLRSTSKGAPSDHVLCIHLPARRTAAPYADAFVHLAGVRTAVNGDLPSIIHPWGPRNFTQNCLKRSIHTFFQVNYCVLDLVREAPPFSRSVDAHPVTAVP